MVAARLEAVLTAAWVLEPRVADDTIEGVRELPGIAIVREALVLDAVAELVKVDCLVTVATEFVVGPADDIVVEPGILDVSCDREEVLLGRAVEPFGVGVGVGETSVEDEGILDIR